nr:hypothetical protein [Tanacetum cinerariifolium]
MALCIKKDVGSVIASGADILSRVGYDPENKEVISVISLTRLLLSYRCRYHLQLRVCL